MKILNDREHRIFLSAMSRERKVCKGEEFYDYDGTNKLLDICDSIERKINDAEPVRHGEWKLYGNDDNLDMTYFCSVCNFQLDENLFYIGYKDGKWIENNVFKYCPNCGAKMNQVRETDEQTN